MQAAYQSVVSTYQLKRIDFDIEANAVTDQLSVARRDAAIAGLSNRQRGPPGDLHLARRSIGLQPPSRRWDAGRSGGPVERRHHQGSQGNGSKPDDDGLGQLVGDRRRYDPTIAWDLLHSGGPGRQLAVARSIQSQRGQIWAMEGITEHIGLNAADTGTFTQTDANQVLQFIQNVHPATISMWSINKDADLYGGAFANIFSQYPSGCFPCR